MLIIIINIEPSCAANNWIIILLKTKRKTNEKAEKRKLYNDPNIELYLVQTELGSIIPIQPVQSASKAFCQLLVKLVKAKLIFKKQQKKEIILQQSV